MYIYIKIWLKPIEKIKWNTRKYLTNQMQKIKYSHINITLNINVLTTLMVENWTMGEIIHPIENSRWEKSGKGTESKRLMR